MSFGRLLLSVLLLVAGLAAVVVGRALMVQAYQAPTVAPPSSRFEAKVVAGHLAEAVKFRTVSWQPGAPVEDVAASHAAFIAFRDWIASTYPQFSKVTTREIVSDYSLLFTWAGSDPSLKPALLMSHMDVVPVVPGSETNWTHDAFGGEIADGFVWGRGTVDTKNGIIGMLEAAEMLIGRGFQPKRTILFAFGHDEEIGGGDGNAKIAALLAERKIELEFVNDEGGVVTRGVIDGVQAPIAMLGVAEKGFLTLELTAHSPGGHSSAPVPFDETAIGRLTRALQRLGHAPFESGLDASGREAATMMAPAMSFPRRVVVANLWLFEPLVARAMEASPGSAAALHTTISPTIIGGGVKENVLPPEAKATVNFRIHPRDTVAGVIAHVRRAIDDDKVDVKAGTAREPSPVSDTKGPQYAAIKRALETVFPDAIVVPNLVVAGTDSRYYFPLTKNVFRIVPSELGRGDIERIHGTNERISVEGIGRIADFYYTLMTTMDEPEK